MSFPFLAVKMVIYTDRLLKYQINLYSRYKPHFIIMSYLLVLLSNNIFFSFIDFSLFCSVFYFLDLSSNPFFFNLGLTYFVPSFFT